jgi:hypothetical protein
VERNQERAAGVRSVREAEQAKGNFSRGVASSSWMGSGRSEDEAEGDHGVQEGKDLAGEKPRPKTRGDVISTSRGQTGEQLTHEDKRELLREVKIQ